MVQGIFGGDSFSIPIQLPMDWDYPLNSGYSFARNPSGINRSGRSTDYANTAVRRCQCSHCRHNIPSWDFGIQNRGEGRKRRDGIPRREIPIRCKDHKEKPQELLRFDSADEAESDEDHSAPASTFDYSKTGDMHYEESLPVAREGTPKRSHGRNSREFSNKVDMERQKLRTVKNASEWDTDKFESFSKDKKDASLAAENLPELDQEHEKQKKLAIIKEISMDVEKLSEEVETFQGKGRCKEYLYLEEMLMKCLLKLDEVPANGVLEIRTSRKKVADSVNEQLKHLEEKQERNSNSEGCETLVTDKNEVQEKPTVSTAPCSEEIGEISRSTDKAKESASCQSNRSCTSNVYVQNFDNAEMCSSVHLEGKKIAGGEILQKGHESEQIISENVLKPKRLEIETSVDTVVDSKEINLNDMDVSHSENVSTIDFS